MNVWALFARPAGQKLQVPKGHWACVSFPFPFPHPIPPPTCSCYLPLVLATQMMVWILQSELAYHAAVVSDNCQKAYEISEARPETNREAPDWPAPNDPSKIIGNVLGLAQINDESQTLPGNRPELWIFNKHSNLTRLRLSHKWILTIVVVMLSYVNAF